MEGLNIMEQFLVLIAIAFGFLSIVLFFKVWGMCNDVRKIRKHFVSGFPTHRFQKGDRVYVNSLNEETVIEEDYGNRVKVKFGNGSIYIDKEDLSPCNWETKK